MSRLAQYLNIAMEELEIPDVSEDDADVGEIDFNDPAWGIAEQAFSDLDTVGVLEGALKGYIATGKRAQAEYCFRKIDVLLESLSDRYGLIYRSPSIRVEMESLDNSAWLQYTQESVVAGIVFIIKAIINGIIAVLNVMAAGISGLFAMLDVLVLTTLSLESKEKEIHYKGIYSWDLKGEWLSPEAAVSHLQALSSKLLPHIKTHNEELCNTVVSEHAGISKLVADYKSGNLTRLGHDAKSVDSMTRTILKVIEEDLSHHSGVYIGGLVVAPNPKTCGEIVNAYKNKHSPADHTADWLATPGVGTLRLSPAYYRMHPNLNQISPRPNISAGGDNQHSLVELSGLAAKWQHASSAIQKQLEAIVKQTHQVLLHGQKNLESIANSITQGFEISDKKARDALISGLKDSSTRQREITHRITADATVLVHVLSHLISNGSGGFSLGKPLK